MAKIGLSELAQAYQRVERSIYRGMEDAVDFNDDARLDVLERDQTIVDAAFFVLIFGQLENRITQLALQKDSRESHRQGLRESKFEKRLGLALRGRADLQAEIEGWYSIRNDVAHVESIASGYEIKTVLARAEEIDALLTDSPGRA